MLTSLKAAVPLGLVLGALALSAAPAHAAAPVAKAAQTPADDTVVLPGRVAAAIRRTQRSLDNAENHVDEAEPAKAVTSLRAVRRNMYRADRAARRQMNAVPADPEAETTSGPDSVIAVLTLDQTVVESLSGLFDTNSKGVVDGLSHAMYRTMDARDRLLNSVIALDPEGAGADYSDGMADTLDGYADEVASISEALADDQLSAGGARVLRPALSQSQATAAKVNLAYGGGE
ncbi:MAG: hypothetical protein QOC68_3056 [Solirubrobacteraceae bacterium]|nr:hypothetical protein [Solirubrobacteraceae bacterium]